MDISQPDRLDLAASSQIADMYRAVAERIIPNWNPYTASQTSGASDWISLKLIQTDAATAQAGHYMWNLTHQGPPRPTKASIRSDTVHSLLCNLH